jgi:hypothetical protein
MIIIFYLNLEIVINRFMLRLNELLIIIEIAENSSFGKFIWATTTRNLFGHLGFQIAHHNQSTFLNPNFIFLGSDSAHQLYLLQLMELM